MSSGRLAKCLQDVFKTSSQDVLEDKKLLRWRRVEDVFKTSWRRVRDVLKTNKCLLGINYSNTWKITVNTTLNFTLSTSRFIYMQVLNEKLKLREPRKYFRKSYCPMKTSALCYSGLQNLFVKTWKFTEIPPLFLYNYYTLSF